jgi:hypothetical protein
MVLTHRANADDADFHTAPIAEGLINGFLIPKEVSLHYWKV